MKRRTLFLGAVTALAVAAVHTPVASAVPPVTTTSTLVSSANPATTGKPVRYTVTVSPAPTGGTVSFVDNGAPLLDCYQLPVVDGVATCDTVGPSTGYHVIYGTYTPVSPYAMSQSNYLQTTAFAVTTTVATAAPKVAEPGETMTYKGVVTPRPSASMPTTVCGSEGGCGPSPEHADLLVDGVVVCANALVDTATGVVSCTGAAPTVAGTHTLTVNYLASPDNFMTASTGSDDFTVKGPAAAVSANSVDFGNVNVNATSTKQVTVTNTGSGTLHVGALSLAGSGYSVAANGCDGAALAANAGCVITLGFKPTAAGTPKGTLGIATDAGALAVTLAGTGVSANTGGTLPPNAKTTFTTTTTGDTSSVTVPLSCPNATICLMNGTVVISTDDLLKGHAAAAALETKTVSRFSGVRVAAGKVKKIKLHLSSTFIKTAQKRGVHFIHAVLTVNTEFGDGTKATRLEHITIRIPTPKKAVVKKKAAVAPHFTG